MYRVFYQHPEHGPFLKDFDNQFDAERFVLKCAWKGLRPKIIKCK
jgi:hypothetical protein